MNIVTIRTNLKQVPISSSTTRSLIGQRMSVEDFKCQDMERREKLMKYQEFFRWHPEVRTAGGASRRVKSLLYSLRRFQLIMFSVVLIFASIRAF